MSAANAQGKLALRLGGPLAYTLFLFSPPAGMSSETMRKRAAVTLLASVVLMVIVYAGMAWLVRHPDLPVGQAGMVAVLIVTGAAFLLVPASLYRLLFGVPDSNDAGSRFLRGLVAAVLFFVVFVGSLIAYGLISG